ncbi:MAG: NIL domain-containing protein [Spirochaetota bacterium]
MKNTTRTKIVVLHYPRKLTEKPIISNFIKKFDLTVNISRARIDQDEEGTMVIEVSGHKKNLEAGLKYLEDIGITIKPVSTVVKRTDELCTHCSACTVICPSGALVIHDRDSMKVEFIEDKCIACGLCIPACPYRAMEMLE